MDVYRGLLSLSVAASAACVVLVALVLLPRRGLALGAGPVSPAETVPGGRAACWGGNQPRLDAQRKGLRSHF